MKINYFKFIIIIGILWGIQIGFPTVSLASTDFLNSGFGVRALGMGGAYTGIAEGPESIFYNYAAPALYSKFTIKLEQGRILETSYYSLCAENILDIPYIKAGYLFGLDGDIPYTQLDSAQHPFLQGQTFGYFSHAGYLAASTQVLSFRIGVGGNFYLESLEKSSAKSFQIGLSAQKDFNLFNWHTTAALTVQNLYSTGLIWSTGHTDTVPYYVRGGLGFESEDNRLHFALDLANEFSSLTNYVIQPKYYLGAEYWLIGTVHQKQAFAVRSGLQNGNITLGCSMQLNGLLFDFVYILPQVNYLDQLMRFSVGYTFEPLKEEESLPQTKPLDHSFYPINRKEVNFFDIKSKKFPVSQKKELSVEAMQAKLIANQSVSATMNSLATQNVLESQDHSFESLKSKFEAKASNTPLTVPSQTPEDNQKATLKSIQSRMPKNIPEQPTTLNVQLLPGYKDPLLTP